MSARSVLKLLRRRGLRRSGPCDGPPSTEDAVRYLGAIATVRCQFPGRVKHIGLVQRLADAVARGRDEGVRNAASNDERVNLVSIVVNTIRCRYVSKQISVM